MQMDMQGVLEKGGSNPDMVNESTPLAKCCNLLSQLFVAVLAGLSPGSLVLAGDCGGWACDKGGAPNNVVDVVV